MFALIFLIVSILTVSLTSRSSHAELARPILFMIAALAIVVIIYPELYRKVWFWSIITVFAVLHLVLLGLIKWNVEWTPSPFIFLLCLGDVAVMILVISLIQRLFSARHAGPK